MELVSIHGSFCVSFRQDLQDLQDCFQAGRAGEFKSAFGGAWVSTVFLLSLLFSMLKPHLLSLQLSMPKILLILLILSKTLRRSSCVVFGTDIQMGEVDVVEKAPHIFFEKRLISYDSILLFNKRHPGAEALQELLNRQHHRPVLNLALLASI